MPRKTPSAIRYQLVQAIETLRKHADALTPEQRDEVKRIVGEG